MIEKLLQDGWIECTDLYDKPFRDVLEIIDDAKVQGFKFMLVGTRLLYTMED